jgi:hypothetical protein
MGGPRKDKEGMMKHGESSIFGVQTVYSQRG